VYAFSRRNECADIFKADIITNTGRIRPIDAKFLLDHKKENTIVLNLFDVSEMRKEDVDEEFCQKYNIPIIGVSESNFCSDVIKYCGVLCQQMIVHKCLNSFRRKYVVVGNDLFCHHIARYLANVYGDHNMSIFREYATKSCDYDFGDSIVVFSDYYNTFGMSVHEFKKKFFIPDENLVVFSTPWKMRKTLDALGPIPLIELHTLGFKAAELYLKKDTSNYMYKELVQVRNV
jgi:hypothetical protein